jgi:pyruvate,water dikinase
LTVPVPAVQYVRRFGDIGIGDVAIVGGKTAALGEMYRAFASQQLRVPNGFAITAQAFRDVIASAGLEPGLRRLLGGVTSANLGQLASAAAQARRLVLAAPLPDSLVDQIGRHLSELQQQYGATLTLAVRSSATAEDLPQASFAGQHDSFLNIAGSDALLLAVKRCMASLFNDRAIQYRLNNGFDHFAVALSVAVMKMVRADHGASGVAFSLDTETGFRDVVLINATYGLGEALVQGLVEPDEFMVFKPTLAQGHRAVLRRTLGRKALKLVYAKADAADPIASQAVAPADQARFCVADSAVLDVADMVMTIERHFSAKHGAARPMDVEWALDGDDGLVYALQARPETVQSQRLLTALERFSLVDAPAPILTGRAIGTRIASGPVRIVRSAAGLATVAPGDVLVAEATSPDWGTVMKQAAAILTATGGRTCHAAIVARELGIPAVVGADQALQRLHDGDMVTVSCAAGAVGHIYAGRVPFSVDRVDLSRVPSPRTAIMMNVGDPDLALGLSQLPNSGVGLARMEFIIAQAIRVHPLALLHPERVADVDERQRIAHLASNDPTPADFFVRQLAEGIGIIGAAFYPKPVIVRLSDFKTNEYANLLGGKAFEPTEENPMLGFRGAARYIHAAYKEGFALECAALRKVREQMGLINVQIMVPFCRSVSEAEAVIGSLASQGLRRGERGLQIHVMCEIPNNVIQIAEFARHFDGFSIGSNDLTQLVLGVDRDSALVADAFNERDPGVMAFIRSAIEGAHRAGRHIGICGQAPSDYPDFAEFLVRCGIDSISLNPDSVVPITERVYALEQLLSGERLARSVTRQGWRS